MSRKWKIISVLTFLNSLAMLPFYLIMMALVSAAPYWQGSLTDYIMTVLFYVALSVTYLGVIAVSAGIIYAIYSLVELIIWLVKGRKSENEYSIIV